MGDIKFGTDGEWAKSGMLQVQYHGIKRQRPRQFKRHGHPDRAHAANVKTGRVIYPYEKAK